MIESLTLAKQEHGIYTDFLEWLMLKQIIFETTREGTDGTLFEHNTVEFGLTRGVIGEAQEALDEIKQLKMLEVLTPDQEELIAKTKEHLKTELADVLIFLASVFVHAGMSPVEVVTIAAQKMETNNEKYRVEHFKSRRVAEAMQYSRDRWAGHTPEQRYERRRANGHPSPRTGTLFGAREEQEYSAAGAGALS